MANPHADSWAKTVQVSGCRPYYVSEQAADTVYLACAPREINTNEGHNCVDDAE
jgi:hypothetical protein